MAEEKEGKEGVIIKLLREATPFEIGLVAFLFLPPILLAWIPILAAIFPSGYERIKIWIFLAVVLMYFTLIAIMVRGKMRVQNQRDTEERKRKEEEEKEKERIRQRKERIRESIRRSLQHSEWVWRTPYRVAEDAQASEEEVRSLLREMQNDGEIRWGSNPEWGDIVKLANREG